MASVLSSLKIGFRPFGDRSMIDRRRWANVIASLKNTPSSSGPRWRCVLFISSISALSLKLNPAIPHIATSPLVYPIDDTFLDLHVRLYRRAFGVRRNEQQYLLAKDAVLTAHLV